MFQEQKIQRSNVQKSEPVAAKELQARKHFYQIINEDDKAEFINGQIVMHSPVKMRHWKVSGELYYLVHHYLRTEDLGQIASEKAMIHLSHNSYEPDLCFWKKEVADRFTSEQMLFPAPTFIAEILSPSTQKNDRGIKFTDYAAHGVEEYWIINPEKKTFEQYVLQNDRFKLHKKVKNTGKIKAKTIKNFTFDIQDIFLIGP